MRMCTPFFIWGLPVLARALSLERFVLRCVRPRREFAPAGDLLSLLAQRKQAKKEPRTSTRPKPAGVLAVLRHTLSAQTALSRGSLRRFGLCHATHWHFDVGDRDHRAAFALMHRAQGKEFTGARGRAGSFVHRSFRRKQGFARAGKVGARPQGRPKPSDYSLGGSACALARRGAVITPPARRATRSRSRSAGATAAARGR